MAHQDYPRSLYRQRDDVGDDFDFDGVRCEMLTVESPEEEDDAKRDGWHNSPAEAGAEPKSDTKVAPAPRPAKKAKRK